MNNTMTINTNVKSNLKKDKRTSGLTYFLMGLLVFLGLAFDMVQRFIDELIYGELVAQRFFDSPWFILVTHWSFVVLGWGVVITLMVKWIRKQPEAKQLNFKLQKSLLYLLPFAIVAGIVVAYLELLIEPAVLPQISREYLSFISKHGSYGNIVSIAQNIYYVVESGMIICLLALMQSAGERWFKYSKIPYCSIGLTLTWGIAHLTHGGIATIWICLVALLMGGFYVISNKNVWASYLFVLLIFVI